MPGLEVGATAPAFTLLDHTGARRSLKEFAGSSLILYFYPAAMTPGCTKQACDFRDNMATLNSSGYQVIGISPDKPEKLASFVARDRLPFPLLSDPTHAVMEKYGAWGHKLLYGKTVTGVIRSTLVINGKGTITHAFYNVRATGHVAKLRRDLGL